MHPSRRAVLGIGALAVTAVGCSSHSSPAPPVTPSSSPPGGAGVTGPDAAALLSAASAEARLLGDYDRLILHARRRDLPGLRVQRAIHATHLEALHGTAPSASARSRPPTITINETLERSARALRTLAVAASDGGNAALLASIAASHGSSVS